MYSGLGEGVFLIGIIIIISKVQIVFVVIIVILYVFEMQCLVVVQIV